MSDTTASPPVLELNGARATIRLNRPKHLNRLQADDLGVLLDLFGRIEADAAVRVVFSLAPAAPSAPVTTSIRLPSARSVSRSNAAPGRRSK
jgi:hypothetical protein